MSLVLTLTDKWDSKETGLQLPHGDVLGFLNLFLPEESPPAEEDRLMESPVMLRKQYKSPMKYQLAPERVQMIHEAFTMADTEHTGDLSIEQLKVPQSSA